MDSTPGPDPGREPRLVRFGDRFTEDELRRGEARLETVAPSPEPAEEPSESWARDADLPRGHNRTFLDWLRRRREQ